VSSEFKPKPFFLDGASGVGKTTLAKMVSSNHLDVKFIKRFTTRPPRGCDDKEEYVFISADEFNAMKLAGEFLEYRDYEFEMSYGLPKKSIDEALGKGCHVLAIINLGRVEEIKKTCPDGVTILIDVPANVIRDRLELRGLHSAEQIAERMINAETVFSYHKFYDYIVPNDGDVEDAVKRIYEIIEREQNE
jgi:guanylate kinase